MAFAGDGGSNDNQCESSLQPPSAAKAPSEKEHSADERWPTGEAFDIQLEDKRCQVQQQASNGRPVRPPEPQQIITNQDGDERQLAKQDQRGRWRNVCLKYAALWQDFVDVLVLESFSPVSAVSSAI